MGNPKLFKAMTGLEAPNFRLPKHEIETFVDDQFNAIRFEPTAKIRAYLEKYYELIHCYYTTNLLKISPDKTQLMLIS